MISVCIASYNGEKYIKEQLESILKQLDKNDEIILSDDHSNDRTLEVVSELNDSRIKVFMNEKEHGYTRNFENALSKAHGDFIFLSDQDDVWVENKVNIMVKSLESADIAISDASVTDQYLQVNQISHFRANKVKQGFWTNFLRTRYIGACMAFRKDILERVLPFPEDQVHCPHDYWIAMIGEMYYRVQLINEPLLLYRRHENNALTGGNKSTNSISKRIYTRIYVMFHLLRRSFNWSFR